MNRFYCFLFLIGLCVGTRATSQSYTGYDVSSYTGVYGTLFNPANILDHRFKADINLLGASEFVQNNLAKFNFGSKTNPANVPLVITRNGRGETLTDVMGPGFMVRLNDKNAIAVTSRFRFQANADKLDPALMNIALHEDPTPFSGSTVHLNGGSFQAHAWNELALTYSRQIGVSDYGVWKGAISLKLIGGQGGAYLTANHLSFIYNDSVKVDLAEQVKYGGIVNANGNLNLNYSDFIDDWTNGYRYQFFKQPGLGADVGVTYEYRDVLQVYESGYNEQTSNYKWKAGASVSDIGSIRYHSSPNSYNSHLTGQQYVFEDLLIPADSTSLVSIANFYKHKFPGTTSDTRFSMALPTTLHLTFDYAFNEWISAAAHLALPIILSPFPYYIGTHTPAYLSVTPRAEISWAGFYLPLTYRFGAGFQSGIAARVGPLTLGSASLFNIGIARQSKSADAYVILRIPLFKTHRSDSEETTDGSKLSKRGANMLRCPLPMFRK